MMPHAKDQSVFGDSYSLIPRQFQHKIEAVLQKFFVGAIWYGIHKRRFRTRLGCVLQTSIAKSGVGCLMLQKPL